LRLLAVCVAALCLLPLGLVAASWALPASEMALANWQHVLATTVPDYVRHTAALIAGVVCVAGVLGVSTAWLISAYEFPGRRYLAWMLVLPLAVPSYIMAMSYGTLLEFAGPVQTMLREATGWEHGDYWFPPIRSTGGAVWMVSLAASPYVYLLSRLAFRMQPESWFEAAGSMGTSRRGLFWRLALPAARPFIAAGIALALMEAIADIGAMHMLGVPTIATGVYRTWFNMHEPLVAGRLASFLLILAGGLLWLERSARGRARYHASGSTSRPRTKLKAGRAWCIAGWCALPMVLGFAIPVAWIMRLCFYSTLTVTPQTLLKYSGDSLFLVGVAALLVSALALFIASAERQGKSWVRYCNMISNLGYAMPGLVIAVGLMMAQGILKSWTGTSMLLTGTLLGLMLAYIVRYMATAFGPVQAGYERINPEMDMAATSLGQHRLKVLWRLHLPMLKRPLLTAMLLVAIDVLKELPATLILRPFNIKTLAMVVFEFAGDDRPVEAAPYALLLVGMATLAVLALHKLQKVD